MGRRLGSLGAVLVLGLLAAGCGGDDSSGSAPAPASASASATTENAGGCGTDVLNTVGDALMDHTEVTEVQVIGGCTQVLVETTLAPGDALSDSAQQAVAICTAAAAVAYTGDVSSISVTGADGHELAAGLQGTDCIPG